MSNFDSRSFSMPILDHSEPDFNHPSKPASLKDAIIDLYLNVKVRNSEDVSIIQCVLLSLDRQL